MSNDGSRNCRTDPDFPTVTRLINTASANLATCGERVRESTAAIQRSCETPGVKGADHRNLLCSKMQELKRLTAFCDIAAVRLMDLGKQIRNGDSQEKSLLELLTVCRSIADQLQCQERDARSILNHLREKCMPGAATGAEGR
ncbi:MAG: hypothetical protein KAV00_14615 [Phycisphaerae bacterium]|nr:hypothetical protein [Phycisphaerae bacterium]